jgi:hypothetical protein
MQLPKKKQNAPDTLIKIGRQGAVYQQKSYQVVNRSYGSTIEDSEEYNEVIVDKSAAEILDQINKRVKSQYYSIYWGIATILCSFSSLGLAFFLAIATCIAYRKDVERKTTPLFYEFSDDYSERKFHDGIASFSSLNTTKTAWRLKSKVAVNDWKRNAGSNSNLIRQRAKIGKLSPSLLKTNIEVWGVDAGSIKLYLLPDKFFVFQDGVYSAISYDNLEASLQELEYIEQESLPNDAKIIGETWKYVRRDGGADKRFKNNRRLPIVKYGVISFSSSNFVAYLIVSSIKVAAEFSTSFSTSIAASSNSASLPGTIKRPQDVLATVDFDTEHLALLIESVAKKTELTTSQISQLLGISPSSITKNSIGFDYEGFHFVRSGRAGRQITWVVRYASKTPGYD